MAGKDSSSLPVSPARAAAASNLTTTFLGIAGATAIVGFAALFATWMQSSIDTGEATLQVAARQFLLGHFSTAADLAEKAVLPEDAPEEAEKLREYLIGAGRIEEAFLQTDPSQRKAELFIGIPHLQTASHHWPEGREDQGHRLLGLALYEVGNFSAAIEPLGKCYERNPTFRDELIPIQAQCYLYGDRDAAQKALLLLESMQPPSLTPLERRSEIECLQAQCLLKVTRYDDARALLDAITERLTTAFPNPDAATVLLETKLKLYRAVADVSAAIDRFGRGSALASQPRAEASAMLSPALERLGELRRDALPGIANQASLWAARAFLCAGQPRDALALFTTVRQQQPFEGDGAAAGIEEVEWLAEAGNGEEAVQTIRFILREIGNEQTFKPTTIDLLTFRTRLLAALEMLRKKNCFDDCVAITKVLPSLFPAADTYFEEGVTHEQAGQRLKATIAASNGAVDKSLQNQANHRFHMAGDAFATAAKIRFDERAYLDTLWRAIEAYQQASQHQRCIELLNEYLNYESRNRVPRGLLALGKSKLAVGQCEQALQPLEDCLNDFPRDSICYEARYFAALAHAEAERFDKARQLLDANLTDGALTPESTIWRDSLYTLGELLYRQANNEHLTWEMGDPTQGANRARPLEALRQIQPTVELAIVKLREAATRYWPEPRAKYAAYLHARTHRLAAVWPRREADANETLEAAKRQLRQKADQHLTAALNGFVALRRDLATGEEEQILAAEQQAMLRNCYVAEADTYFDLGRYEEAADAYRAVSLRYMNEPPALEAMLGQARCLRQLKRMREARLIVRQAVVILGRIPTEYDDEFLTTTRFDRKRWKELLTWLDAEPIPEQSEV